MATVPMTVIMKVLHRKLPAPDRHPLPPRHVTMKMADESGGKPQMTETERTLATYAAHFSFGAATGAVFGPLSARLPGHPVAQGVVFGLGVWALSYLGWLLMAGIIPPATQDSPRRNALMIAAHVTWGAAVGAMTACMNKKTT